MLVDGYNVLGLGQEAWEHLVLYFWVPVGVIVGVLQRSPVVWAAAHLP